jgi:pimeloyl-ACP methyl ester carboxylesterase
MSGLLHSPCRLSAPNGWVIYLAHQQPTRLVVFVHGFRGGAVRTWSEFDESGPTGTWWSESDLLFVSYDSVRDNITGVSARLRRELPRFFPEPADRFIETSNSAREITGPYQHLVLVGHSLGGLIVRRALADCAQQWLDERAVDPDSPMPDLLKATTRLFSPASAGFRDRGRDRRCWRPRAQIPACAASALGSSLGCWRRTARRDRGA